MSTTPLTITLIERRDEIPLGAQEWNALVARNDTNTVFQTYEWFDSWWQVFGHRCKLFFLVLRQDAQIVGFAPLMICRGALGLKQLEFIGTGNSDYLDFVFTVDRARALEAVCRFLQQHSFRWQRARLCNLPRDSATLEFLRAAGRDAGLYFIDEAQLTCPTLMLEEDAPAAWRLIGKASMRRPERWFSRHGEVHFRHLTCLDEIESLLPRFFEQHVQRWRAAGKPSLFEGAQQREFYTRLARSMHERGWLLMSVVEFNGEPIAFHFGFDYMRGVVWYKPSFDVRYADRSPGLLLTRALIEDCLRRARRELDFTVGDETFKGRFANQSRANLYLGMYHSGPTYLAALFTRRARRIAGGTLRGIKRLLQALTPTRSANVAGA